MNAKAILALAAIAVYLCSCEDGCEEKCHEFKVEINSFPPDSLRAFVWSGGHEPFYYNWSNGGITQGISDVSPGIYTVTVTDNLQCSASASYVLGNVSGCGTDVTDVDGNIYSIQEIGGQCWLKSNLITTKYRNGDDINEQQDSISWADDAANQNPVWCYYGGNPSYNTHTGKLYNWYVVNDPRGVCPAGWHVPSYPEYIQLITYLGGANSAGGKLKTNLAWHQPNAGGDDSSGFTAKGGGVRNEDASFNNSLEYTGSFWTTTNSGTTASALILKWDETTAYNAVVPKGSGRSIRCIKD